MNPELRAAVTLIFCGMIGIVAAFWIVSDPFFQGIEDSTKYNLYAYSSNADYETGTLSINFENYHNDTAFYDFTGNTHHVNDTSADSLDATGYHGQGRNINDGYMDFPDLDITAGTSFTCSMWIYPTAVSGTRHLWSISSSSRWRIINGNLTYNGYGAQSVYSNVSVSTDEWTFITVIYDTTDDDLYQYFNTTCVGHNANAHASTHMDGSGEVSSSAGVYAFLGIMDEWRVWSGDVRTPAELAVDMETAIETPLTINTVTATDVVQLWYQNDTTLDEQQTAGADLQVIFNVFDFSGQTSQYNGIVKVSSGEMRYEDYIRTYDWGDVYNYTIPRRVETWAIAAVVIMISIIFGMILTVVRS